MRSVFNLIAFLLLISSAVSYGNVSVTTYNMGQLKKKGIDFVACTSKRVQPQMEALFNRETSPLFKEKHFVLFLQEAWTKKIFRALKAETEKNGFYMHPQTYKELKNNGQISITNLQPIETVFVPFSQDSRAKKGMLYMKLDMGDGTTLGATNVHTTYSDLKRFGKKHELHFKEVSAFIEAQKQKTDHFILGGDFNAGPDMEFKNQKYNSQKVVWEDGFMPSVIQNEMKLITDDGVNTWDESCNSLVSKPTFIIRMMNLMNRQKPSWDTREGSLDHLLVSNHTNVVEHGLVFDKPVPMSCPGREDKDGNVPLSDHYGVNAVLEM